MSKSTSSVRPGTLDRDRFASALRESLFRKKLTQKELAHRLNMSQPTVSGWVNAQKTPGRDNLTRLVNELGLKTHEITTVQSLADIMRPDEDALALPHVSVESKASVAETSAPASIHEEATSAREESASGGNVEDGSGPACSASNDSANPSPSAKNASPRDDAFDAEILMPTETDRRYRSRSTGLKVSFKVLGKVSVLHPPSISTRMLIRVCPNASASTATELGEAGINRMGASRAVEPNATYLLSLIQHKSGIECHKPYVAGRTEYAWIFRIRCRHLSA